MNQDMLKEIEFPSGPMGGCIQYFIFAIHKYYMDYTWFFNHFAALWKKLKSFLFDHEDDPFEDEILNALNKNKDLNSVWARYVYLKGINLKFELLATFAQN